MRAYIFFVSVLPLLLSACGPNSNRSEQPASQGELTGKVSILYIRTDACSISLSIANGTQYHLNKLVVQIPEIAKFEFDDLSANHQSDETAIADVAAGGCEAMAHDIEAALPKVSADSCSLDGVPEGTCQSLLSVSSAIDYQQLSESRQSAEKAVAETAMENKRSLNHTIGERVFVGSGGIIEIFPDAEHPPAEPTSSTSGKKFKAIQGDQATIQTVEKDANDIAIWYKVDLYGDELSEDGTEISVGPMSGWVKRDDFDKISGHS